MIIGNKNITSLNDKGDNYFLRGLFLSQSLSLKKQMYLRIIKVQILFKFHKIFCQYRNLAFTQAFFPHQEYLALPYLTFPHNSHPLRVNLFCTLSVMIHIYYLLFDASLLLKFLRGVCSQSVCTSSLTRWGYFAVTMPSGSSLLFAGSQQSTQKKTLFIENTREQ